MPRWSSWSRLTTPRSNIRPCRTGIPATPKARAASTTSSPSAATAAARNSKISWTQVETGSAITWKYPSCILRGDHSRGEFYSVAISNGRQQVDTGTKMIHLGKNTTSRIISKGISAGKSKNTYRGLVTAHRQAPQRAQLHQLRLAADRRRIAARIPCRISRRRTPPPCSSTRRRPRRSPRTSCSTACSAGIPQEEAMALVVNGFVQGCAAATADGIRGRSAEADRDQPRRQRRLSAATPLIREAGSG